MPLFRTPNAKLIYYAHVPKCAGTTMEQYLIKRFGAIALQDTTFGGLEPSDRWSLTSPQHMPERVRQRYLPDDFLDDTFAIVRHPATRLRSVFLFQREFEGTIPLNTTFNDWIEDLPRILDETPDLFDGHVRPMTDMVPDTAEVFQVENGLDAVISWLDGISDSTAPDTEMVSANVLENRLRFEKRPIPKVWLTDRVLERVADIYASDYARFGYEANTPEPTGVST